MPAAASARSKEQTRWTDERASRQVLQIPRLLADEYESAPGFSFAEHRLRSIAP
jgi:hypothetical protein